MVPGSGLPGAVGAGGHAHDPGEEAGEVEGVVDAELKADLVKLQRRGVQQLAGMTNLQKIEIIQR